MRDELQLLTDLDYAAYLCRNQADFIHETLCGTGLPPRDCPERLRSTSYFAFYQRRGRWAWQRVNAFGDVIAKSQQSFAYYLQCASDARLNGWTGRPIHLFAAVLPAKRSKASKKSRRGTHVKGRRPRA